MAGEVDLLSPPANFAVVQLRERKFPGVVVQGDTLRSIQKQVERMGKLLRSRDLSELEAEIDELNLVLTEAVVHFERICAERGLDLPY